MKCLVLLSLGKWHFRTLSLLLPPLTPLPVSPKSWSPPAIVTKFQQAIDRSIEYKCIIFHVYNEVEWELRGRTGGVTCGRKGRPGSSVLGFAWSVLGSEARAIMGVLKEEVNRTDFRTRKPTPAAYGGWRDETDIEQVAGNLVAFGLIAVASLSSEEDGSVCQTTATDFYFFLIQWPKELAFFFFSFTLPLNK